MTYVSSNLRYAHRWTFGGGYTRPAPPCCLFTVSHGVLLVIPSTLLRPHSGHLGFSSWHLLHFHAGVWRARRRIGNGRDDYVNDAMGSCHPRVVPLYCPPSLMPVSDAPGLLLPALAPSSCSRPASPSLYGRGVGDVTTVVATSPVRLFLFTFPPPPRLRLSRSLSSW